MQNEHRPQFLHLGHSLCIGRMHLADSAREHAKGWVHPILSLLTNPRLPHAPLSFTRSFLPNPRLPLPKKKPSPPSRTSAFSVLPLASLTRLRLLSLASLTRLRLSQRGVGRRRRSRCEMSGGLFRVNILFHIPPPLDLGVCV